MMNFMYTYTKTSKARRDHFSFHVILGPQPVIDAGSGRCFWRASTHPDPEMATTGKRQREAGGGGSGGGKKKGDGPGQGSGGGGAGAGPELPGARVSFPPLHGVLVIATSHDHLVMEGRSRERGSGTRRRVET